MIWYRECTLATLARVASRKLVAIVFSAAPAVQWPREAALVPRKGAGVPKAKKGVGPCRAQNQGSVF